MKRARLVGLLLPPILVACADPYSAAGYCEHLVDQLCHYEFQCCRAGERGGMDARTEDECRDKFYKEFCPSYQRFGEAVDEDRARWDTAKAKSCFAPFEKGASECNAKEFYRGFYGLLGYNAMGTGVVGECSLRGIMAGNVDGDKVCYISEECKDKEAACQVKTATDPTKPLVTKKGTCESPPRDGQACASDRSCARDHYCDAQDICRVQYEGGHACTSSSECQSYSCNMAVNPPVCASKLATGESCMASQQCESNICGGTICAASWESYLDSVTFDVCDRQPGGLFGIGAALPPP